MAAVFHALGILSWYENLPKDEQPPRHIWWSAELLDQWFEKVTDERNSRTSTGSKDETVPMMGNELLDREAQPR